MTQRNQIKESCRRNGAAAVSSRSTNAGVLRRRRPRLDRPLRRRREEQGKLSGRELHHHHRSAAVLVGSRGNKKNAAEATLVFFGFRSACLSPTQENRNILSTRRLGDGDDTDYTFGSAAGTWVDFCSSLGPAMHRLEKDCIAMLGV